MLINSCIADGAGTYRTCRDVATCPIRPPLQTHLHAVCRGKNPAAPKKVASRKGNSAPHVGLPQPDPAPPLRILAGPSLLRHVFDSPRGFSVYRTRVSSRGPGEFIERSWRPRAKFLVAEDEGHDALGWRHGVGLLEKYSRPGASLFFGADMRGRVPFARRNPNSGKDGEADRSGRKSPPET